MLLNRAMLAMLASAVLPDQWYQWKSVVSLDFISVYQH
jgi:hypothetical protein